MRFPCEPPEYFAARCLRARKFSLPDALKLVEVTTAWRKEVSIDALATRHSQDILGCLEDELQFFYQKSYFSCRDNDGRPVYVERGGTVDVEAMFSASGRPRRAPARCARAPAPPPFSAPANPARTPLHPPLLCSAHHSGAPRRVPHVAE